MIIPFLIEVTRIVRFTIRFGIKGIRINQTLFGLCPQELLWPGMYVLTIMTIVALFSAIAETATIAGTP